MEARTMREKLKEAKGIYYMDDFRVFIRKLQDMTDEDFKKPAPRINDKILNSEETDSKEIQNKPDMKFHQKRKEGRNG